MGRRPWSSDYAPDLFCVLSEELAPCARGVLTRLPSRRRFLAQLSCTVFHRVPGIGIAELTNATKLCSAALLCLPMRGARKRLL